MITDHSHSYNVVVVVPSINIIISDTTMETLQQTFDPFEDDGDHVIDLFCNQKEKKQNPSEQLFSSHQ